MRGFPDSAGKRLATCTDTLLRPVSPLKDHSQTSFGWSIVGIT